MAERISLQDHELERRIVLMRLALCGILTLLLFLLLAARFLFLQLKQYDYYAAASDRFRIYVQPIVPQRGLIYDRNGILLAENVPSFNLTLTREYAGDIDSVIAIIKPLIALTDEEIATFHARLERRSVPYSSVPLRSNVNEEEIARISVNQFRLPGVNVETELVRHYTQGEVMAHAIGYLGRISEEDAETIDPINYRGTKQIGKTGAEKFYESVLHGRVGYETVEKNAHGQILKVLDTVNPTTGRNLVLHLDSELQKAAAEALGDYRGAVVALDPSNGGVLALVSKPSFNPDIFSQGISQRQMDALNDPVATPLFNRALAKYAPGSTLKPFLGLAALEYNLRTRESTISDPGYYRLANNAHVYHDWTWWVNKSGHGQVNLQKAIYQSCDVYFYDLAVDMGIDPMHDFLQRFGFGRNATMDMPQASSGTLPSSAWKLEALGEPWYPGDTLNSSIGQGFTEATPMQLATATMLLANKGKWFRPTLLKQVGLAPDAEGGNAPEGLAETDSRWPAIMLSNPDDWEFMRESMVMVVHKGEGGYRETGTAYPYLPMAEHMPYRMAGKSGTAQVVAIADDFDTDAEVPERYRDHAWFIAYAPAENPEIALAVFVEHGEGGSSVAAPIARRIVDAYLLRDGREFQEGDS